MAEYFYSINGCENGPFTLLEMQSIIERSSLPVATPVKLAGSKDWNLLMHFPELQKASTVVPTSPKMPPFAKWVAIIGWAVAIGLISSLQEIELFFKRRALYHSATAVIAPLLKAPSTAKFCPQSEARISTHLDQVSGWVDAQNSFGAMLRQTFTVDLGPDRQPTCVKFGERVLFDKYRTHIKGATVDADTDSVLQNAGAP